MDKYAVIQLGGKQFKVTKGTFFEIERQGKLDINVLSYSDGKKIEIGEPYLKNIEVKAKIKEWKKKGYDTGVLKKGLRYPCIKDIKAKIKEWKRKGYDTRVLKSETSKGNI